jgi:hypothetical protein
MLSNGTLRSGQNNIGYIASNTRFCFGNPSQSDIVLDASFSICSNASLAFGGSTVFYRCFSDGSFGIFNKPNGVLCSTVLINITGTPASSASASLATITTVTIHVGSEAKSSGSSPSGTVDKAGATPIPTGLVEFDLDASGQDALLVERSWKTLLRHHSAIVEEKTNRGNNSHVCKADNNGEHHRHRFHKGEDNECNHRKFKHGYGGAKALAAPSSLAAKTTLGQEPLMNGNRRRQVTSTTLFPTPSTIDGVILYPTYLPGTFHPIAASEYLSSNINTEASAGLSSYWSTPKSLSTSAATTLTTVQKPTVPTIQPAGSVTSFQSV